MWPDFSPKLKHPLPSGKIRNNNNDDDDNDSNKQQVQ